MWPWWVKIPTVDVTDETLAIDDTHGDDVRGGDWGAGHGGWQGGWHGIEDVTVSIGDTYGDDVREIVVLVMEVDKVADEVTDVEIDK